MTSLMAWPVVGSQGIVPRHKGEVVTLPHSMNGGQCVEILTRLLEFPCQKKMWMKKMLPLIGEKIQVLPPRHQWIIKNDDEDIIFNWKSYVNELIKELRIVQSTCFSQSCAKSIWDAIETSEANDKLFEFWIMNVIQFKLKFDNLTWVSTYPMLHFL